MEHLPFSDYIKNETHHHHQALEKLLISRIKAFSRPGDYISLLGMFHGFWGALEDRILDHIAPVQLPDHAARRKSARLADDILALGGPLPDRKAKPGELPEISSSAQAWGALYVMEGATLGGVHIKNMIVKLLHLNEMQGFTFFSGYGEETGQMWERFKEALIRESATGNNRETITASANNTFLTFKDWIHTYEYEKEL